MVHGPVTTLRITSGAIAGSNFVTSKNRDGSVSFNSADGSRASVNVPNITKGTFAVGAGALPCAAEPVIIKSPKE